MSFIKNRLRTRFCPALPNIGYIYINRYINSSHLSHSHQYTIAASRTVSCPFTFAVRRDSGSRHRRLSPSQATHPVRRAWYLVLTTVIAALASRCCRTGESELCFLSFSFFFLLKLCFLGACSFFLKIIVIIFFP